MKPWRGCLLLSIDLQIWVTPLNCNDNGNYDASLCIVDVTLGWCLIPVVCQPSFQNIIKLFKDERWDYNCASSNRFHWGDCLKMRRLDKVVHRVPSIWRHQTYSRQRSESWFDWCKWCRKKYSLEMSGEDRQRWFGCSRDSNECERYLCRPRTWLGRSNCIWGAFLWERKRSCGN